MGGKVFTYFCEGLDLPHCNPIYYCLQLTAGKADVLQPCGTNKQNKVYSKSYWRRTTKPFVSPTTMLVLRPEKYCHFFEVSVRPILLCTFVVLHYSMCSVIFEGVERFVLFRHSFWMQIEYTRRWSMLGSLPTAIYGCLGQQSKMKSFYSLGYLLFIYLFI